MPAGNLPTQRGHKDDEAGCNQRLRLNLVALGPGFLVDFAPRFLCRGLGFAQGDQAHLHRLTFLEAQPDRRFEDLLAAALQMADEIERLAVGVESSGILPRRAHDNVAALRYDLCDPLGLQNACAKHQSHSR
ncbi:hypothetical protein LB535_06965 [Mesorhizobium sp. CA10]|uniref:hypothetical protein n=1 Tax=Mesorhizobium sp. CA10 TaxID=588495 RepID=UPI001CCA595A|nr:hypothetical protein [Mesorhizobium sp. CA10]MBZ9882091.1 hypothetical protein [Mesorhizobium sp. CA10]